MKIAILSWETLHGPAWTDAAIIASETARALVVAGHEVHVFTACGPRQAAEGHFDGVHYHRCAHDADPNPSEETRNFTSAVLARLRRAEEGERFAVVHGFEWPTAAILGELRRTGEHTTAWSFSRPDHGWEPPVWMLDRPNLEPTWSYHPDDFADRIFAPEEDLKRSFLAHWGLPWGRVEILYPGIDPNWPGPPIDPAQVKAALGCKTFDPVVLASGHLTPEARPGLLLEAMPLVLEKHPNAKVIFAGDGEMIEFLTDRTRVLNIEQAVRLTGEVSDRDLAQLCQASDVICLPQRTRSLVSPCLNAWAAAKPVVIARGNAAAAFVWHDVTGCVTEDTSAGLASGVLSLFEDFERCRLLGANGRRAVEDAFGWPTISGQLLHSYRQATAETGIATII
ncbi:MAG: glycosyltransferase [Armatimonadetes bacterium]|nr:glycosyltransferase [Armatimonadota bacterium]